GEYLSMEFRNREPRQRDVGATGQFARQSLNFNDDAGEKAGWAPASRCFLQTCQAIIEKALSPFADDLTREVQTRGDDIVPEAGRCQENDFRAHDVSIRRRISARRCFQRSAFFATERDEKWAPSWHQMSFAAGMTVP